MATKTAKSTKATKAGKASKAATGKASKANKSASKSGRKSRAQKSRSASFAATLTAPKGAVHKTIDFELEDGSPFTADVFELVRSYDPNKDGPWQKFIKSDRVRDTLDRKLLVNETGLRVPLDGKVADGAAALSAHASVWGGISQLWEVTAGYGNQHYTGEGPMHFAGVDRLDTEELLKGAGLFIEVIAQRAALKGLKADDPNFQNAATALSILAQFIRNRPDEIKESAKQQAYKQIKGEEGTEVVAKAAAE